MTILLFLLVLTGLVLLHEAGHYLAARLFGIKAEEFGVGFPPRAIGWVKEKGKWKRVGRRDQASYAHTIWSLNWLPLGGFVRIKGEQEEGVSDSDSINAKPIWQRIIVIAAGVIMNWITAVALFTIVFAVGVSTILESLPSGARVSGPVSVALTQVLPGSPAEVAGLQVGDEIQSIGERPATRAQEVRDAIQQHGTSSFLLGIKRGNEIKSIQVTPRLIPELDRPGLGVGLADVGIVRFSFPRALVSAGVMTAALTKEIFVAFGSLVRNLIVHQQVPPDVSGPVGIAVATGQVAKQGGMGLLQFAAMLSINLAVLNVLPIPALDGGRLLFLIVEKLRRRPLRRALEAGIHNAAFLILILLIFLITVRDVSRYGGVILGGVRGWIGM